MATSAVAAGKISLAVARSEQIPKGWIIDAAGRHTTDPKDFRKGGALLPLGGTEGYKGSGLAAMVEVLCGLLTGLGFGVEPTGRHNDGCFMAVFNVAAFRPLQDFKKEVAEFARYLKSTPLSEGSNEVFYPGKIEYLREQERRKNGNRGRGRNLGQVARARYRIQDRGRTRFCLTAAAATRLWLNGHLRMMRSLIMATTPIASTHQAERLLSSSTVPGSVAGIAWAPRGQ
jgi:hypothetical protein